MNLDIVKIEIYNKRKGALKTIKKYEQLIIKSKDPFLCYWFAKNIEGANIDVLEKIVLESKNLEINYYFAKDIKGADITAHGKVILESNDLSWIYNFAKDVDGIDVREYGIVIINSKNLSWNYYFAKNIKGADIKVHGKVIIDSNNLEYNYNFALIDGSDVEKHAEIVAQSKNPKYNYNIIRENLNIDIKPHLQAIIDSKDLYYNYEVVLNIKGIDIKPHEQIIIDSKDPKYNYYFIRYVKGAYIIKHINAIKSSSDPQREFYLKLIEQKYPKEQTLTIVKPDGIPYIDKIIDMFYKNGLEIKEYELRFLDKKILSKHYSHLLDQPFYPTLESYMLSGPVVIMILEGYDAINNLRNLMGPTDSTKAPKGTIRGEFGTDITLNAIHGSDRIKSARDEIKLFFGKEYEKNNIGKIKVKK